MSIYDCTLANCPVTESIMYYRPSLAANATFLALFAITGIAHTFQGLITRKPYFMVAMQLGCVTECIGYAGRIISWNNPFSLSGFLINICCLTLAPAFFAAALYFTLGDVVRNVSVSASRIRPRTYALIFIPCDCISLTLQGTGGGMASAASESAEDVQMPTNIMIGGLAFQVVTMTAFVAICIDYAYRVYKQSRSTSEPMQMLCSKSTLWLFTGFFTVAILGIYIRTVYRVIELAGGWDSELYRNQGHFIILEGVMIVLAVLALHVGHPGNLSRHEVNAATTSETPAIIEDGKAGGRKEKGTFSQKFAFGKKKRASETTLVPESSRDDASQEKVLA